MWKEIEKKKQIVEDEPRYKNEQNKNARNRKQMKTHGDVI